MSQRNKEIHAYFLFGSCIFCIWLMPIWYLAHAYLVFGSCLFEHTSEGILWKFAWAEFNWIFLKLRTSENRTTNMCCMTFYIAFQITSSEKQKLIFDVCNRNLMEPECCFGNCLELLSECKTCAVPNYKLWMNDGICDGFLNNQDCCFDFEDCVGLLSDTRNGRISTYYGDIQREYLKMQGTCWSLLHIFSKINNFSLSFSFARAQKSKDKTSVCLYILICDFSFADSKKSYTTIGSLLSDEKCTKQWNQYYYSGIDLNYKKYLHSGEKENTVTELFSKDPSTNK